MTERKDMVINIYQGAGEQYPLELSFFDTASTESFTPLLETSTTIISW